MPFLSFLPRTVAVFFLFLVTCQFPVHAQSSTPDNTRVRVRLNYESTVESVEVTAEDAPIAIHLSEEESSPVMRLRSGETATLSFRQQDVFVQHDQNGLYATELHLVPQNGGRWVLQSDAGTSRTYTGSLHVSPASRGSGGLLLVNDVPLEDYVASVVASEYGLDDEEGRKAMAIVARTYGLFTTEKFSGAYDQADNTTSQVYNGIEAVTGASRQAARETRGQVLTYDGSLIQSVYFSSSGGHTANNEDVWKADEALPYLRGKKDPYDSASPHHRWSSRVNRSSLLQALSRKVGRSVEGFLIDERTQAGRIRTFELLLSSGPNISMQGNAFRLTVNAGVEGSPLKSTWFDAKRQGSEYVFEGRGFGHGVGLNQWGAHAMAKQGKSYREILTFYYTGVQIERLDGVQSAPPAQPVAKTPPVEESADSTSRRIGW